MACTVWIVSVSNIHPPSGRARVLTATKAPLLTKQRLTCAQTALRYTSHKLFLMTFLILATHHPITCLEKTTHFTEMTSRPRVTMHQTEAQRSVLHALRESTTMILGLVPASTALLVRNMNNTNRKFVSWAFRLHHIPLVPNFNILSFT